MKSTVNDFDNLLLSIAKLAYNNRQYLSIGKFLFFVNLKKSQHLQRRKEVNRESPRNKWIYPENKRSSKRGQKCWGKWIKQWRKK